MGEQPIKNTFNKPKVGRPYKIPKKRGPKPKNVQVDDLTVLENNMRRLLGMMENEEQWSDKLSAEQVAEQRDFLENQILHTSRLSILYITGCVSGAWHADAERSKMAIFIINQAVGTPTQKVAMIGESEESKRYLNRLLELKDNPTQLEELKVKEVSDGQEQEQAEEGQDGEGGLGETTGDSPGDAEPVTSTD